MLCVVSAVGIMNQSLTFIDISVCDAPPPQQTVFTFIKIFKQIKNASEYAIFTLSYYLNAFRHITVPKEEMKGKKTYKG